MKKLLLLILLKVLLVGNAISQSEWLQSGPMVGATIPGATTLWVQTKKEAFVKIKYYEEGFDKTYFFTNEYKTQLLEGYTALLVADKTEEGKVYLYELYINNILVPRPYLLSFKTTPPPNEVFDFKVALGSCVYVNDSLNDKPENYKGGSYGIYSAIYSKKTDLMLWLGDNVYFRKKDWSSKEGMIYRYTHTRSLPSMQALLGSVENYAIWDDHDYGPNDSDKGFKNKKESLEVFNLFWANPSDDFDKLTSTATTFTKGDVQFFLLDDRTFRDPGKDSTTRNEILGENQLDWLAKELKKSKATFKVVAMGGQVLNPLKVFECYSKYKEWNKLLELVEDPLITGVIFLSGDRHFSETMKLERAGRPPLYEFTVSPLNSRPYKEGKENNPIRVSGSLIQENNFAVLEFYGKKGDRALRVVYYDVEGKFLFEKKVIAQELK